MYIEIRVHWTKLLPICIYENIILFLTLIYYLEGFVIFMLYCYLFNMYCSNYCSSFWFDSSKTAMKNIKITYNNSLKWLLSLPKHNSASEMFVNLNILSLGEL